MNDLKDSGERQEFTTGSVRDASVGKGRVDVVPYFGIMACAMQMEAGMEKYGLRNWEKGQPLMRFLQSAQNHLLKEIAGFDDEPHMRAAIWNLMCYAEGIERINRGIWPAELDDRPKTYAGQDPEPSMPVEFPEDLGVAESPDIDHEPNPMWVNHTAPEEAEGEAQSACALSARDSKGEVIG